MEIHVALTDSGLPRLDARLLLSYVVRRDHAWLVAHDRDALAPQALARYEALVARRVAGEPMAYLVGEREFYGRAFRCSPAALIPRPETELLVETALATLRATGLESLRILDVGTGTGCIAITLALECVHIAVSALDVSADALALARENADALGAANVNFLQSDWFCAVGDDEKFDLIVSNPPYVVPGDAHLTKGDLRFEPAIALVDALDGLESYRQLARGAIKHLKNGGWLVVEHGFDQGKSVPALLRNCGFTDVRTLLDLAGHPRVTLARWHPS